MSGGVTVSRVGDLLERPLRNGISPSSTGTVDAEVLTLSAITGGSFKGSERKAARFATAHPAEKTVSRRDLLICRGNGNIKLVGRARRPVEDLPTVAFPDTIIGATFDPRRVDLTYMEYLWDSRLVREQIEELARSTNGTHKINQSMVENIEVPLPPIEEQQRIAALLDAADELRAKRREALAKLDTLGRAIFIDMFGGGSRPPVNPGPVDANHPSGWAWLPLHDVARMATGHTPDRSIPEYWDGDVGWVNLNEIRRLDGRWCSQTELTITPDGVANSSAVVLPAGTVCFSRTASIGFVTALARPMATSQDFVNWVCGDDLRPDYLMWAFLMSRNALRASSSGSTHRTIYVRDAQRFHVLVPPLSLQQAFEERLVGLRGVEERMHTSEPGLSDLFTSLQQRAFRGEL